ncbi:hypothetical protein CsatA_026981 [Cannabis sativa]
MMARHEEITQINTKFESMELDEKETNTNDELMEMEEKENEIKKEKEKKKMEKSIKSLLHEMEEEFDIFSSRKFKGKELIALYVKRWNIESKQGKIENNISLLGLLFGLEQQQQHLNPNPNPNLFLSSQPITVADFIEKAKLRILDLGKGICSVVVETILIYESYNQEQRLGFIKNSIKSLRIEENPNSIVIKKLLLVLDMVKFELRREIDEYNFSREGKGKGIATSDDAIYTDKKEIFDEFEERCDDKLFFLIFYLEAALCCPVLPREWGIEEVSIFLEHVEKWISKRVVEILGFVNHARVCYPSVCCKSPMAVDFLSDNMSVRIDLFWNKLDDM